MMNIEVGKTYRLENGFLAYMISIDTNFEHSVKGVHWDPTAAVQHKRYEYWDTSGNSQNLTGWRSRKYDVVEEVEMP